MGVLIPMIYSSAMCVSQLHGRSLDSSAVNSMEYNMEYIESRWTGVTTEGSFHVDIYVATQIFATFVDVFLTSGSLKSKWLIMVHHVISLVSYINQIRTGRMEFFANLAGLSEVTTVPLMFITLMRDPGYGAELKKKLGQTLFVTCAASLWLSYIIFRMILFPHWLYVFVNDITWIVLSSDLADNDAYKDNVLLQLFNNLNRMEK